MLIKSTQAHLTHTSQQSSRAAPARDPEGLTSLTRTTHSWPAEKEHETKSSGPRSLSVTNCGAQCLHFPSVKQWSSVLFLPGDARDSGLLPAGDRAHCRAAFLQRAYPQLSLTSQLTPGGRGQPSRNTGWGMLLRTWERKEKRSAEGPKEVHGWRPGSFHASPRIWVKAIISQNMSHSFRLNFQKHS